MGNDSEIRALLHHLANKITPRAAHLYLVMSPAARANEARYYYALVENALKEPNEMSDWIRARFREVVARQSASRAEDLRLRQRSDVRGMRASDG